MKADHDPLARRHRVSSLTSLALLLAEAHGWKPEQLLSAAAVQHYEQLAERVRGHVLREVAENLRGDS